MTEKQPFKVAVPASVLADLRGRLKKTRWAEDFANDQWAYYQAKDIRLHADRNFADFAGFITATDYAKAQKARQDFLAEAEKYEKQTSEIQADAKKLEAETDLERRRANRYDLGEVFLEVGLVVTSITLLSGRRAFWHAGVVLGIAGVVSAATSVIVK